MRLPTAFGRCLTIGREASSDIIVGDDSVSRRHAEVTRQQDGSWLLRDVGSSNGTFHQGQRVRTLVITTDVTVHLGAERGVPVRLEAPAADPGSAGYQPTTEQPRGLIVRGLQVRRGGKDLLRDVDVAFAPGELVAVIGPSGAGKSTFVRTVTGAQQPSAGQVLLDGYDVHASGDAIRDLIGFVPQDDVLHASLTVRQCLLYSAAIRLPASTSAADQHAAVSRVVGQLGLAEHVDQRIDTLSGGQRKRVGTALELLSEPSLLVLDEPTSGLDPHTERQVMDLLASLAAAGHTVLVVTHSPVAIEACERAVVIARGALVYSGPSKGLPAYFRARTMGTVFARVGADEQGVYAGHWRDALEAMTQPAAAVVLPPPPPQAVTGAAWRRQAGTTARRNVRLLVADRGNLALLLGGAPALGLLVRLIDTDGLKPTGTPNTSALNVLLALVLCVVWIGTFNAVREVVKERQVLDRERRAGLAPSAYLVGKFGVLGGLLLLQVTALLAVLLVGKPMPLHRLVPGPGVELGVGLMVTGLAAVAIALLVSALVSTSDKALAMAPLVVVPQLVLAGALTDVHSSPWLNIATVVVTARWGLSIAAASVNLAAVQPGSPHPGEWAAHSGTWLVDLACVTGLGAVALVATLLALRSARGGER